MKRILTLTALILIAGLSVKAQSAINFISQQHQQVKFDSVNHAYFVDTEVNSVSRIRIQDNAVFFVVTDGSAVSSTKVDLTKAEIEAIAKGESFTKSGVKDNNGNNVKVSFWFIAGELDEISYTNETAQVTLAYRDISGKIEDNTGNAIALNKTNSDTKL